VAPLVAVIAIVGGGGGGVELELQLVKKPRAKHMEARRLA
jgi:NADH dehydrogenase FAD-containing subunit